MKTMKSLKTYLSLFLVPCSLFLASCGKKDAPVEPAKEVSNLSYTIDGRQVTLSWQLPADENVLALQIVKENDKTFKETEGAVTGYVIEKAEVGVDLTYTVRVISDRSISKGVSVTFYVEPESQPVPAMVLLAADPEALPDDDEVYAARWFKAHYVDQNKGAFLPAAELGSISVNDYSMLFILVDRVGLGAGWANLPSALISDAALAGLRKYVEDGGNIYLAKMATPLVSAIGRIEDRYAPGIFGDGDGGTGDDTWCVNANIGIGTYDHRYHPIYQTMETNTDFYGFEVFPLLGPGGFREDHNTMWDCNAYGFAAEPNVIKNFEDVTASTVLGTWGHVSDYCCAGIVEFHPTGAWRGTIIANGLSAYEFKQNNQDNRYQANIEKLTENTIDYLSKRQDN
ncbi:MAG: DUF4960 domain-containing protein [Paludibacteraceae bacterium]|nr:DUF4960 domain-containing protein [Paludibacteraceae bacterium]